MFCKVMDACTENYECLVLDNTVKSNKIQDCVFWYKASLRKNFRVGDPNCGDFTRRCITPSILNKKKLMLRRRRKKLH